MNQQPYQLLINDELLIDDLGAFMANGIQVVNELLDANAKKSEVILTAYGIGLFDGLRVMNQHIQ